MSTPAEEIQVDLDKPEDKKPDAKPKIEASGAVPPDVPDIQVVAAEEPPKKGAGAILKPEEGLEKLKKQLEFERAGRETERQARLDAERRAQEASEGEARARTETQVSQLDQIKGAIVTLTQANAALKSKYREARANNDADAEFDIQEEIAKNAAKLQTLEDGKVRLERAPKPVARAPVDPVDEYVSRIPANFPRSREWVRAHPEFVRDKNKNDEMVAAHNLALARGHQPESDPYFASVEKTLDIGAADQAPSGNGHAAPDESLSQAAAPVSKRTPPPSSAPVSRSGNGAGPRPNTVTLSAAEREIAAMNGMTDREYAIQKLELQREGKLN